MVPGCKLHVRYIVFRLLCLMTREGDVVRKGHKRGRRRSMMATTYKTTHGI